MVQYSLSGLIQLHAHVWSINYLSLYYVNISSSFFKACTTGMPNRCKIHTVAIMGASCLVKSRRPYPQLTLRVTGSPLFSADVFWGCIYVMSVDGGWQPLRSQSIIQQGRVPVLVQLFFLCIFLHSGLLKRANAYLFIAVMRAKICLVRPSAFMLAGSKQKEVTFLSNCREKPALRAISSPLLTFNRQKCLLSVFCLSLSYAIFLHKCIFIDITNGNLYCQNFITSFLLSKPLQTVFLFPNEESGAACFFSRTSYVLLTRELTAGLREEG